MRWVAHHPQACAHIQLMLFHPSSGALMHQAGQCVCCCWANPVLCACIMLVLARVCVSRFGCVHAFSRHAYGCVGRRLLGPCPSNFVSKSVMMLAATVSVCWTRMHLGHLHLSLCVHEDRLSAEPC